MLIESARAAVDERRVSVVAGLSALSIGVLLVAPRASFVSLALLVPAAWLAADGSRLAVTARLRQLGLPFALMLAFAGWALLSVVWAADKSEALNKSLLLGGLTLVTWLAWSVLPEARGDWLGRLARTAVAAFCVCLAYLLIEEATRHQVKRLLFTLAPFLMPDGKHIGEGAQSSLLLSDYISNRNMAALALLTWPTMLLSRGMMQPGSYPLMAGGLLALAAACAALSAHETTMIALAASALVFVLMLRFRVLGLGLVVAGWLTATLLVVPLASLAYGAAQLQTANWLPNSARQRIVIWAYAAGQVPNRPLHGVGAASTKLIDAQRGPQVEVAPGTRYQWRSSPHSHNVYLQVWYELGAIGAGLLSAFGLAVLYAVYRLPRDVAPYAAATLVVAAIMGAFTWGLWQAWFIAAFCMGALMVRLALQAAAHVRGAGARG